MHNKLKRIGLVLIPLALLLVSCRLIPHRTGNPFKDPALRIVYDEIPDLEKVTNLNVTEPVADFKGMEKLSSLKTLTTYELKGTTMINSLSRVENLIVLELNTSPAPLECLTKLQTLTLHGTDLTNLSFLGGLTNLKTLFITTTGGQFQQVDILRNLSELKDLTLGGATLTDINFITDLPKLKTLDISSTAILDLSPALAHPALRLVIATDKAGLLPALRGQNVHITYKKPAQEPGTLPIVVDQRIFEELHEPLGDVRVKPSPVTVKQKTVVWPLLMVLLLVPWCDEEGFGVRLL